MYGRTTNKEPFAEALTLSYILQEHGHNQSKSTQVIQINKSRKVKTRHILLSLSVLFFKTQTKWKT